MQGRSQDSLKQKGTVYALGVVSRTNYPSDENPTDDVLCSVSVYLPAGCDMDLALKKFSGECF